MVGGGINKNCAIKEKGIYRLRTRDEKEERGLQARWQRVGRRGCGDSINYHVHTSLGREGTNSTDQEERGVLFIIIIIIFVCVCVSPADECPEGR